MFDFIHALVESSKFKAVVKTHLQQLLYFLLVYMEITEDQVWKVFTFIFAALKVIFRTAFRVFKATVNMTSPRLDIRPHPENRKQYPNNGHSACF